jgi:glycolate oxidase iron-sulfur subunit
VGLSVDLGLDDDELNSCVQCGLCLPYCPTYRVSGDESMSPRGRIALMRAVQNDDAPITDDVKESFETCVQCRGCEPACPSAVPYGHLIEGTREALAESGDMTPRWQRLALKPLAHPRLLRGGTAAAAVAQRAHLVPDRLGLSVRLPIRQEPLQASGDDVYLFTGCVMDAWQRGTHQAGQRVLEAAGFGVTPTGDAAPCCGALQLHAGITADTRRLAAQMIRSLAPDRPVLVDSAGCGAAMKDYGRLLDTRNAHAFADRVFDIQEWLAPRARLLPEVEPLDVRVAVQDPCHLRHVQRVHEATRTVLRPFVREVVELDDEGLCCGAGGAYSQLEPVLAADIRARKIASIERARPDVVASANPGCAMHLSAGGVRTAHPMELVWEAIARSRGS